MPKHKQGGRGEKLIRVNGYVTKAEKVSIMAELQRIAQLEGLRDPGLGLILARIVKYHMRFDTASLMGYEEWLNLQSKKRTASSTLRPPVLTGRPPNSAAKHA